MFNTNFQVTDESLPGFLYLLLSVLMSTTGVKMYRTTRSPMMQPLVNSGMGMAPFFKVNKHTNTGCRRMCGLHVCLLLLIPLAVFPLGDCVRAGAFPGQVSGVHLRVLQHPGVRTGQHPLHQGGERSVSLSHSVSVNKGKRGKKGDSVVSVEN